MPNNQNQTILLKQLQKYVTIASQSKPIAYHAQDVKTLIENLKKGCCSGISALWLYHKSRETEKYFYDSIINPILAWNSSKETLSPELEYTLEYALSILTTLQACTIFEQTQSGIPTFRGVVQEKLTIQQTDCDFLINLIKQDDYPSLRKEYEISFVFTNNELQELLKSIQPNKLIQLSSSDHAIALFFDGQEYILFNPNGFLQASTNKYLFEKRFAADEIENLVKNIQSAFMYKPSKVTGLTISVFDSIKNPTPDYLDREKQIEKILETRTKNNEIIDINEGSSYDSCNPLYFAARNGHTEIVKLLLLHGAKIEKANNNSWSPIHTTAQKGHFAALELLLNSAANKDIIDTPLESGHTPLYLAAQSGHTKIIKLLLYHGAKIGQTGNDSWGPIHIAVYNNDFTALEALLHSPASKEIIDAPLESGETPLYLAAENGHTEIVELLLRHGAKIEKTNNNSWGAIHTAARNNHFATLELLLNSAKNKEIIDTPLEGGATPLYLAAQNGHTEIVALLLRHGAKIEKTDNDSWNPIHTATKNNHFAALEALLNSAASKDIIDTSLESGATPLYLAAQNGDTKIIELLLRHGAKIEKTSKGSWGPIHTAAQKGHFAALELLLNSAINKEIIDTPLEGGYTSLYLAAQNGHTKIIELLLCHGAKIEQIGNDSWGPIHIAAYNNHFAALEILLNSAANKDIINIPLKSGDTPLYLAAQNGDTKIIELLLHHGAKIDQTSKGGWNPIHIAVYNKDCTALEALLHSPASKEIIDAPLKNGHTPLSLAAQNGHTKIVKLLLHHGAKIGKTNNNSWGPIDIAEKAGHIEIVKLLKSEQLKQSKILQEAKHETQKNWIDKDYTNLVKIKTAYLTVKKKIKALDLTLPVIPSKMERLKMRLNRKLKI